MDIFAISKQKGIGKEMVLGHFFASFTRHWDSTALPVPNDPPNLEMG